MRFPYYEAVNIQHITVTESREQQRSQIKDNCPEDLEIPFSDPPETRSKHRPRLKTENRWWVDTEDGRQSEEIPPFGRYLGSDFSG